MNFKYLFACCWLALAIFVGQSIAQPNICYLPMEVGNCKGSFKRYFYNKYSGACQEFIYGGCSGNENNFETYTECNNVCNSFISNPCTSYEQNICHLPVDNGHNKFFIDGKTTSPSIKYFFNRRNGKCEKFMYGGCDGNANRFDTYEICMAACYNIGF